MTERERMGFCRPQGALSNFLWWRSGVPRAERTLHPCLFVCRPVRGWEGLFIVTRGVCLSASPQRPEGAGIIAGGERANARVAPGPRGKNTGAPGRGDRKGARGVLPPTRGSMFFLRFLSGVPRAERTLHPCLFVCRPIRGWEIRLAVARLIRFEIPRYGWRGRLVL